MATVRDLIDEVLLKHWSFQKRRFPPGGLLVLLQRRCDELLVQYARSVEPIVGESRQMAGKVSGILVGLTAGGAPVYTTTSADGYAVQLTAGGTPYFDFTQAKIATDPLGVSSANPGFPLPDEYLKYIALSVVYSDGRNGPVVIIPETQRHEGPQGRDPVAYINGNRIVPVRAPVLSGSSDEWTQVTSLRISYVKRIAFTALSSVVRMPAVLSGCLVAGLAHELARSAPVNEVSLNEKAVFLGERSAAETMLERLGDDVLGDLRSDSVIYLG